MSPLMHLKRAKPMLAAIMLATASLMAQASELTVSAAASLTNAFKDIAQRYEARHPDTKVLLNFGASGALLQQIEKGAPVDIFASADQETMDMAVRKGLVAADGRRDFVRNSLVLIVPADSQRTLARLDDLAKADVQRVAIGNPASVPVGRYTQRALEAAKLWPAVQSKAVNTQNVRQSLDYVTRGEVDAGFVYSTDAAAMPDKVKVALSVPLDVAILYPIATLNGSANATEAQRFIAFVLSPDGQEILGKYGFQKP